MASFHLNNQKNMLFRLQPAYLLPKLLSFLVLFTFASLAIFASTNAFAHKPSDSYLTMSAQAGSSDVTVRSHQKTPYLGACGLFGRQCYFLSHQF